MELLETLELKLSEGLSGTLPGLEAHRRMMPEGRDPGEFPKLKNPNQGGVLILLYSSGKKEVRFPLTLRHDYSGVHSGQVSLPGGRYEPEDEDLIYTALRETEEEIGIDRSSVHVVGKLSRLFIPPSNYLVTPVVGVVKSEPEFILDPHEVRELFTVSLQELLDEQLLRKTDMTVRSQILKDIPYYHFNERVVWGATAMILSEFSSVLREILN